MPPAPAPPPPAMAMAAALSAPPPLPRQVSRLSISVYDGDGQIRDTLLLPLRASWTVAELLDEVRRRLPAFAACTEELRLDTAAGGVGPLLHAADSVSELVREGDTLRAAPAGALQRCAGATQPCVERRFAPMLAEQLHLDGAKRQKVGAGRASDARGAKRQKLMPVKLESEEEEELKAPKASAAKANLNLSLRRGTGASVKACGDCGSTLANDGLLCHECGKKRCEVSRVRLRTLGSSCCSRRSTQRSRSGAPALSLWGSARLWWRSNVVKPLSRLADPTTLVCARRAPSFSTGYG